MVNKSTLLTTVRASFLQLKHWETGYQNSGTLWLESKLFEKQINHYPLEQFVGPLTSGKGWRMVELLPKVFWFQFKHNVPDIWYSDAVFQIIHCSYVITGQVMLERSINLACWPLEKLDGEWLNCCQKFFISNYNISKFLYSVAVVIVPIFYLDKSCSNGQQIWLAYRLSNIFDLSNTKKNCWTAAQNSWYSVAVFLLIHCSYVIFVYIYDARTVYKFGLFTTRAYFFTSVKDG